MQTLPTLFQLLLLALLLSTAAPAAAQNSAAGDFPEWETIGNALDPRAEGQIITYQGDYYLFSGYTTDTRFLNRNEKYDPATNTWTQLSNLPQRSDGTHVFHTHTSIALVDDEIWHIGGRSADPGYRVTRDVWIYNIPNDSWRRGPDLPKARGGGGAARLGRTIHYIGGFDERSACDADDHFVYDLDHPELGWQDFTGTSPMPLARNHFGTTTLGGKLYTVAGQHAHDGCEKGKNLQYVHVYDPYTDRWQRLADFPHVQSHIEPSTFAYNGKIYSLGGQGQESASVAEYDPARDEWRILSDLELPLRLIAPGARVHEGNLVVMVGGRIAVNLARSEVRVRNFFPNQTRKLAFHPGDLRASGTAREFHEIILANYSAEDATTYTLVTEGVPEWITLNKTQGTARESFAEVELTTDPRGLAPGTYSYTLCATAPGYTPARMEITLTVGDDATASGAYYGYREAECADAIGTNWVQKSSTEASNGSYVEVRSGANSTGSAPTRAETDHLSFDFDLPQAGKYQFFARVEARSTTDDSFWYRINGGGWEEWGNGLTTYNNGFDWRRSPRSIITLPAGRISIDIAYREDGLRLDKVLLSSHSEMPTNTLATDPSCEEDSEEAVPDPPTDGVRDVYVEAECAEAIGTNWVEKTAGGVSNGKYLEVRPGANSTASVPTDPATGHLNFVLDLPQAGNYYFFARAEARTTSDDSFWYRINGGSWQRWYSGLTTYDRGFDWRRSPTSPTALPAGPVTLDIAYREDGFRLDRILLSLNGDAPTGTGPANAACDNTGAQPDPTDPPTAGVQEFWGEAECVNYGAGWRKISGQTASNGSYLVFGGPTQFNAPSSGTPDSEHVRFTTTLAEAGTYYLYVRLDAADNSRNSFWIKVDNGNWLKFWKLRDGRNMITNGLEWRKVTDDTREVALDLMAGTHTITIANREAGTLLDKVLLSRRDFQPAGQGAPATNCGASSTRQVAVRGDSFRTDSPVTVSLSVFPNPTSGDLTVDWPALPVQTGREGILLLQDIGGRVVLRQQIDLGAVAGRARLDVAGLSPGIYQLRLIYGADQLRTAVSIVR